MLLKMVAWYHTVLFVIALISLGFSVVYSFRYRLQKEPVLRGLYAAKMNVSMGILLVSIAIVQLLLFEPNTVRVVLGALFFLIGLFNIFAGGKNHSFYKRKMGS